MIQPLCLIAVEDPLDSLRLLALAGARDVAGDGLKVLAGRTANRGSRMRHLVRASACYGAVALLRKIAL